MGERVKAARPGASDHVYPNEFIISLCILPVYLNNDNRASLLSIRQAYACRVDNRVSLLSVKRAHARFTDNR